MIKVPIIEIKDEFVARTVMAAQKPGRPIAPAIRSLQLGARPLAIGPDSPRSFALSTIAPLHAQGYLQFTHPSLVEADRNRTHFGTPSRPGVAGQPARPDASARIWLRNSSPGRTYLFEFIVEDLRDPTVVSFPNSPPPSPIMFVARIRGQTISQQLTSLSEPIFWAARGGTGDVECAVQIQNVIAWAFHQCVVRDVTDS